ncbi:hypothetical protein [Paracraurococcus lichenis]|uniref:Uncharacterized protein n=1 Tax=Paracraurococcus lichenis TaxID=3064888 RepID=A0ABT9E0W8_9PROT|nr:hypothetical protein [Paracraurococcus sp. LOR1-02]MDO9709798.1 hypothetical protein [Paracraurococcus sp. LOR1-02]
MSTLAPIAPPSGVEVPTDAAPRPRSAARAEPGASPAPPAMPNPSLRLDPALGLVVLEFRDQYGRTATLPTERELAAYRHARGRPDPASSLSVAASVPGAAPAAPGPDASAAMPIPGA